MKKNETEKFQNLFESYWHDFSSFTLMSSKQRWIGQGGFGGVYLCNFRNEPAAVKWIKTRDMTIPQFSQEVKAMMELTEARAENVIRLLAFNVDATHYKIVMQYADNRSLDRYLFNNNIDWDVKSQFVRGTISGLKSIHQYHIIHRDLKCANILIDTNLQIKIGDFGLSTYEDLKMELTSASILDIDDQHYTSKTDVHSLGLVLQDIAAGNRFYYPEDKNKAQFISQTPEKVLSLIRRCSDRNPMMRPTAAEAHEEVNEEGFFQRASRL
jgi:serine/threonine protein kinase